MLGIGEKHELATVFLIDDDLISREVIATVLTLHGHLVHTAETGDSALELLGAGVVEPGVVLMDAQLPGIKGTELIRKLREGCDAEIILISGSQPADELVKEADGFLLKPFGPEDLARVIGEHKPKHPQIVEDADPVINPETLAQFRQLMTEATIREIYAAVVSDLHKRQGVLEKAITEGNSEEVRRLGHAIKGGCGMAGAMQAARIGATLESKSDQLDNCATAVDQLYMATQRLERMLEKEFPA
ncbi:response regulator [Occallatibacter savannae]|uniref:response regulator n=1 Tax=Occallatibacter savannae TaxID=1002691 RepID=UPI000D697746|nr:response regulator [Occallatibacter savannae]